MKRVLGLFVIVIYSLFIGINVKALTMDEVISEIEKGNFRYPELLGLIDFAYNQDTLTFTLINDSVTYETKFTYDVDSISYNLDYDVSVDDEVSLSQNAMDSLMILEIINIIFNLNGIDKDVNDLDVENMTYKENGIEIITKAFYEDDDGYLEGVDSFKININNVNPLFVESPLKIEIVNVGKDGVMLKFESSSSDSETCTLYRAEDGSEIAIAISDVNCNGTYLDNTINESGIYSYYITYSSDFFVNSESVSTVYNLEDYESSEGASIDSDTTTGATDKLENPNTGAFMPIAILLGMLGASIILIINLKKKNKFNKI